LRYPSLGATQGAPIFGSGVSTGNPVSPGINYPSNNFYDFVRAQITTHTTVGATIGMALAIYGGDAVQWAQKKKEFPFYGGMVPIVLTWFVSPIIAGVFVLVMFGFLRTFVLRSPHSFARALWVLPGCVGLLLFVLTVFIAQTYYKNKLGFAATKLPGYLEGRACWIGAVVAAVGVVATVALAQLVLKKRIQGEDDRMQASAAARKAALAECGEEATDADKAGALKALADVDAAADQPSAFSQKCAAAWNNFRATRVGALVANNAAARLVSHGVTYRVHDELETDDRVAEVWESAEVFDYKTERLFRHLQVLTACAMAFAHGSNDVSNAMGPFSAVVQTWRTGAVPVREAAVPIWILVLGGAGIVTGLAVFGYKVLAVLAVRSVKLTNARGACVELASALTVILASRFGLPVSTTQVVCGAVLTVGLMEGAKGVNW
jgi:sodium-dependent phosphate transporter